MVKNIQNQIEESGISSKQRDKSTDYSFVKKTPLIINLFGIPIIIIKIIYLYIKIFFEELLNNYKRKNLNNRKQNIFFIYNSSNFKNNWYFPLRKKNNLYLNFTSPYPSIEERSFFGKFKLKSYFKAIKVFIEISFIPLKKKISLTNFRFSLFELMSFEKFFTYLVCINLDEKSRKKFNIYHQYENLPRDIILLNYLKKYKIYSCVTTPTFRYDRPNITSISKRKIKPKNLIFFYLEKYIAFKKEKNLNFKVKSISILRKKKLNIKKNDISKLLKKKYFKKFLFKLSNKKSEEKLIENIFKNNKNVYINYHPLSKKYVDTKNKNFDKTLVISSIYTNAAYDLSLKGFYVVTCDFRIKKNNPYRYINIPKYNINEIAKLIK